MGKKRAGPSAAIAPAAGKKMTFGDDDDFETPAFAPSSPPAPGSDEEAESAQDDDSDSDSDAAPEAVGMKSGAADERRRAQQAEECVPKAEEC